MNLTIVEEEDERSHEGGKEERGREGINALGTSEAEGGGDPKKCDVHGRYGPSPMLRSQEQKWKDMCSVDKQKKCTFKSGNQ
ncbi:hypothetical protein E2562_032962 [Oryza meyeriana var. granulata]|uniref:Uncharacterized protein n=1 Tax=Oryza meyeriana var. granulata TaxID=110450 RepID=A0A6G1DA23_9ORYZ|nr:hypothetical protein E2562_032962 [Oryza meyeriana var. granulata]